MTEPSVRRPAHGKRRKTVAGAALGAALHHLRLRAHAAQRRRAGRIRGGALPVRRARWPAPTSSATDGRRPRPPRCRDIKGPINILLVGIDPRQPTTPPLADSIMILHVPAGMDRAYLFSMPRDLRVDIPAFPKAELPGRHRPAQRRHVVRQHGAGQEPGRGPGLRAAARPRSATTPASSGSTPARSSTSTASRRSSTRWAASTCTSTRTSSPSTCSRTARPRPGNPNGERLHRAADGVQEGHAHLKGWQALDYVRQRKTLVDGDYDRQRHQQQFIRAMASQALSRDVVTNPIKLDSVLRAAGQSLIFDGRGHSVVDWAFALRNLRSDSMTLIKLPHAPRRLREQLPGRGVEGTDAGLLRLRRRRTRSMPSWSPIRT